MYTYMCSILLLLTYIFYLSFFCFHNLFSVFFSSSSSWYCLFVFLSFCLFVCLLLLLFFLTPGKNWARRVILTSENPVKIQGIQEKSRESRRNPGPRIFTGSAAGPPKIIFWPNKLWNPIQWTYSAPFSIILHGSIFSRILDTPLRGRELQSVMDAKAAENVGVPAAAGCCWLLAAG